MELKEFIKETIIQITDGVIQGHGYIADYNKGEGVADRYEDINFDIAITSNEEEKTGVGGKITVASIFKASADNEQISKLSNYNRIQFKISLNVRTQNKVLRVI